MLLLLNDLSGGAKDVAAALKRGRGDATVVDVERLADLAAAIDPGSAGRGDHHDQPLWRQLVVAAVRDTRATRPTSLLIVPVRLDRPEAVVDLAHALRSVDRDLRPVTLLRDDVAWWGWGGLPVTPDGAVADRVAAVVRERAVDGAVAPRLARVAQLLDTVRTWAEEQPDVRAVAVVGSWARGTPSPESDVDVVLVVDDVAERLADPRWIGELGDVQAWADEDWGSVRSRRATMADGLEVEVGVTPAAWLATPPDPGTAAVLAGAQVLHDPSGALAGAIAEARGGQRASR